MRRGRQSGITLMEVLIAVSLLSLVAVGMLTAMRIGLSALDRTNRRLISNRRVTGAQRVLEQQIAGFMPVIALMQPGPGAPGDKAPFFHGEPQSMRFVSSYSLQEASRGYPRILEFQVIPRDDGEGVRLVVNEHIYTGPASAGRFCMGRRLDPLSNTPVALFRPIAVGPGSFVLADRLAFCRFYYLTPPAGPAPNTWQPAWTRAVWPRAVRIDMAPREDENTNLRPVAVTAPLRVDRFPIFDYVDY
ncbi:MAG: prepilin-type N-terminal cleavage/methylation domain-containing protein [Bryobacterales bacterium]|nr:prepilin-type N-terminal cleavage/methylation domain-containing protein [Bryobacterales bacterium]